MSSKRLKVLNGLILLTLIVMNARIFMNRDKGYAYTEVLNYKQLYTISENFQIKRLAFNGSDSLTIFLNEDRTNSLWEIGIDSLTAYNTKGTVQLKLIEGKHEYRIKNLTDRNISITIGLNYVTEKSYQKFGRTRTSDVELLYCSVALGDEQIKAKDYWKQSSKLTTQEEIAEVQTILKQTIGITNHESSISKIKKIGCFIRNKLASKQGTPADEMDKLGPQKKMEYALNNHSKVWCGDFTDIFSFYANEAGITTRLVCTEGEANGIPKSGHSFNECYIPELKQWIFVDLTSGILSVQNAQGKYLNGLDLYNAHLLQSSDLTVTKCEHDSTFKTNYTAHKSFYADYFNPETHFVFYNATQFSIELYSFKNKFLRYITKRPTFAAYANSMTSDNKLFYQKQALLILLCLFVTYMAVFLVISRLNKEH